MHALLDVPDRTTRHGRIEHAILLFLYKTGARVSEATQLRVGDLQVGRRDGGHALVTLHGKGGKVRQCPLRPEIERVMVELVDGRAADDAVFLNRRQQPFTRFGVYSVVERCAAQVPALAGRKITPHALRHTTACHLVFAGVDTPAQGPRLITSPAFVVIKAADEFRDKTAAPNQLWQTDFTYLKVIGWGRFYLSTILDDFSRYIIAWKLCTTMRAEDVTDTLKLALEASGCSSAEVVHKPRLPQRQRLVLHRRRSCSLA